MYFIPLNQPLIALEKRVDCDVGIFSAFSINPSSSTYAHQHISGKYLPHKMLIQLEKIPEGKAVAKTLSGSGDENKDSGKPAFSFSSIATPTSTRTRALATDLFTVYVLRSNYH